MYFNDSRFLSFAKQTESLKYVKRFIKSLFSLKQFYIFSTMYCPSKCFCFIITYIVFLIIVGFIVHSKKQSP